MPKSNLFILAYVVAIACPIAADAEELPKRRAAPAEYVRVCDQYGAAFFYIPGTNTCLRLGGAAVGEWRSWSTSYRMSRSIIATDNPVAFGTGAGGNPLGLPGHVPNLGYSNARSGDNTGFVGIGRAELDARAPTDYGTMRAFVRLESYFGSDSSAATGSLSGGQYFGGANFANGTTFRTTARETTILNKAFLQFGGLTVGRVQSFFDFYTDNINWEALRGSNATVGALAYTYSFRDGVSLSFSLEDNVSRRGFIGSTIGSYNLIAAVYGLTGAAADFAAAAWGTRFSGVPDGVKIPDIVGAFRIDQPWGGAQISAAAHQLRSSIYTRNATVATPVTGVPLGTAIPAVSQEDYGYAAQLGLQFNLDKFAPEFFPEGDKLWIQGTYARGAVGYLMGNNLSFNGGPVNGNAFYGYGNGGVKASNGWEFTSFDCVWTAGAHCDKSTGWAALAAFKHYWTPTLSSGLYGSVLELYYSPSAIADFGGGVGAVNTTEYRIGSNLVWTPIKNFDLGGELMYLRDNHHSRPVGLAPDIALWSVGLPSWKGANATVEGRLRLQRSF
ncbi:porin [Methylosinus sporium]|uniref:Porin n=1 Tax=Methylosinus sporium TaxID=428 RepID=A0A549SSA0_METSR|nr:MULTISPECIES: porin [Methylosinus]MBU3888591.1 porin [Methylosinus sp. KRF6]TRL32488.1 porin [Methylosinus sporium]